MRASSIAIAQPESDIEARESERGVKADGVERTGAKGGGLLKWLKSNQIPLKQEPGMATWRAE